MKLLDVISATTFSTENTEVFVNMPAEEFVEQLRDIEPGVLKMSYVGILRSYLLDLRLKRFDLERIRVMADDLHNLPNFIAKDFKGFSELLFWKGLYSSRYLREEFIKSLWEVSQMRHYD